MENKFYLKSKTIIGALIAAAAVFGVPLPFTEEEADGIVRAAMEIFGFVLVIYGRIKADKPLGFK